MHFSVFFPRKTTTLKKNEKHLSIFYNKNRNTNKFHAFTIENDFENASESVEFRYENCHKTDQSLIIERA